MASWSFVIGVVFIKKILLPILAAMLLMAGVIGLLAAMFGFPLDAPLMLAAFAFVGAGMAVVSYARIGQFVSPWTKVRGEEALFLTCYGAQLWPKAAARGQVVLSGALMTMFAESGAAVEIEVIASSVTLILPSGRACTVESSAALSRVTFPGSLAQTMGHKSVVMGSGPPLKVILCATASRVNVISM